MNIHVPPDVAKQRQFEMQMKAIQAQQESNFYSVALQVFLKSMPSMECDAEVENAAKRAIRIAEVFYRTVDGHRQAKAEELSRQNEAGLSNRK